MAAKFSVAIRSDVYQKLLLDTLGDEKVKNALVAELSTCVAINPKLQECTTNSIISGGLTAHDLNLPLGPLGYCYLIPRNVTRKDDKGDEYKEMVATFQVGWKGFVQMAVRTGAYREIGVIEVHEGELKGRDRFGNDIVEFTRDYDEAPTIGYFSYFQLNTGLVKTLYWSKDKCEAHGKRYSEEYRKYGTGKWKDDFDNMAKKTLIKQILSKWGVLSKELELALKADEAEVKEDGTFDYVDNEKDEEPKKLTNVSNSLK